MGCQDFFAANAENKDRCKLLQDMPVNDVLGWEQETASEHSPGPVSDDEVLVRQVISPIHYDEATGELTAMAFDDASNKGLSVNRLLHAANDELVQAGQRRVEQYNADTQRQPRTFWGLVHLRAAEVRAIAAEIPGEIQPARGFVVFDTAYQHDPSHADICQILKKAHGRSVRAKLRDLANAAIKAAREV